MCEYCEVRDIHNDDTKAIEECYSNLHFKNKNRIVANVDPYGDSWMECRPILSVYLPNNPTKPIVFRINYCPICGRKLGEDGET